MDGDLVLRHPVSRALLIPLLSEAPPELAKVCGPRILMSAFERKD